MRVFHGFWSIALVSVLGVPTTSCYRLTAAEGGASTMGRELVLEISPRGAIDLAPRLGAELRSVTGRVTDFRDDAYRIAVTQTDSQRGIETLWRGEEATIPRSLVSSVAERQLDRRRTWTVVGLSVLGAALAGKAFGIDYGLGGLFRTGGRGTAQ